ncbi:MAG: RDD family protein [Chitinophagaceae bacterium]
MNTADKGARIVNFIIDGLIYFILLSFSINFLFLPFSMSLTQKANLLSICSPVVYFGYYFLFEYLLGKTPAKFLTKTITVDRKGYKPTLKSLVIRTLLRLTPYDSISFIFGQGGLHDSFSQTIVVNSKGVNLNRVTEKNKH